METEMLERILYVSLLVSDQDKALDYYTNVLGFKLAVDAPTNDGEARFIAVGVDGQEFQLILWPGTPGRAEPAQGRVPATYTIETKDLRKDFEELRSRGVKFETDVLEFPWGYIALFEDPDGNRLQLREARADWTPPQDAKVA
jgi:predicted enzyme related to lactoylglutathione lyase